MKLIGLTDKWQDILQKIDLDGNGRIDFHEFYTAAVDHKKVFNDQNIFKAFQIIDVNGDGYIDINEF
jgi:calcium-dependent protein kinase